MKKYNPSHWRVHNALIVARAVQLRMRRTQSAEDCAEFERRTYNLGETLSEIVPSHRWNCERGRDCLYDSYDSPRAKRNACIDAKQQPQMRRKDISMSNFIGSMSLDERAALAERNVWVYDDGSAEYCRAPVTPEVPPTVCKGSQSFGSGCYAAKVKVYGDVKLVATGAAGDSGFTYNEDFLVVGEKYVVRCKRTDGLGGQGRLRVLEDSVYTKGCDLERGHSLLLQRFGGERRLAAWIKRIWYE